MTLPAGTVGAGVKPGHIDYVFLSFKTSTAFSPTDTMPLTAGMKLLMMLESTVSLGTLALVAARAMNILAQASGLARRGPDALERPIQSSRHSCRETAE
jgi:hypothetical protein